MMITPHTPNPVTYPQSDTYPYVFVDAHGTTARINSLIPHHCRVQCDNYHKNNVSRPPRCYHSHRIFAGVGQLWNNFYLFANVSPSPSQSRRMICVLLSFTGASADCI